MGRVGYRGELAVGRIDCKSPYRSKADQAPSRATNYKHLNKVRSDVVMCCRKECVSSIVLFSVHRDAVRRDGKVSKLEAMVGCLGQSPGEPPLCFLNWDTATRNEGDGTLRTGLEFLPVSFMEIPSSFSSTVDDWDGEVDMHQSWPVLASRKVLQDRATCWEPTAVSGRDPAQVWREISLPSC